MKLAEQTLFKSKGLYSILLLFVDTLGYAAHINCIEVLKDTDLSPGGPRGRVGKVAVFQRS